MRNLIFILLMAVGFTSYAQEEIVPPEESQVERVIDKYGGKIVDTFNNMVETVVPIAEDGFNMVVRLEIAKGIVYLIPTVLSIVFWFILNYHFKAHTAYSTKQDRYYDLEETVPGVYSIITGILAIATTIMAAFTIKFAILHLMAPEWFAIKEIIGLLK